MSPTIGPRRMPVELVGTYRGSLPKTLRDWLEPLGPDKAEAVAREALTIGLRTKGPTFTYAVKAIAHGAYHRGNHPVPPQALDPLEAATVRERIAGAVARIKEDEHA